MHVRTLILGAGAAGLMCAAEAGPGTLVVDHARAPGEKIRISGGGRCNFTNLGCVPERFLSQNPHFAKSALGRYTPEDFLMLVEAHGISWHEKALGQLFCDGRATQIVDMLLGMVSAAGADLWLSTSIEDIGHDGSRFHALLRRDGRDFPVVADRLVLSTGGLSIPKMGATNLSHRLAQQFGLRLTETRPGLVPLTFQGASLDRLKALSGISAPVRVTANGQSFDESALFTHRGLSGPAILQVSSYWSEGADLTINLDPHGSLLASLRETRSRAGRVTPAKALSAHLPQRLATAMSDGRGLPERLADCSDRVLSEWADAMRRWHLRPGGTEGYRTAEVTLGGIDTNDLDGRTMSAREVPGLYAIGEAVDVTGWLGGYNFQWAWASGWAAGQSLRA